MSAIWGYIDLNKNDKYQNCQDIMSEGYSKCALDRVETKLLDNGFFACGLQCFCERAQKEPLPVLDYDMGYMFTADIILNGRRALAEDIASHLSSIRGTFAFSEAFEGADADRLMTFPDGELAYIAWLIWKEKFVDHITGMFAIAVYDINKREFYMFADHMGTRCINYCIIDGQIFFSTLLMPIVTAMPKDYCAVNERFIAGAESNSSPELCLFPGDTPFENVYQLCRGSFLKANAKDAEVRDYWNPLNDKIDIFSDKRECRSAFRSTFFECVQDAIDTDKNIAATISSGLDSTSVAGVAARKLAKQNRTLYGFTQVPLKDYVSEFEERVVADESKGVKSFLEGYPNIEHCFDDYEGKSAFTEVDRIVSMMEVPVKAMTNLVWIDDILSKASQKGCKVLLIGQFGNGTISRGNILGRVYQELTKGNFKEARKQLAAFGRRYGVTRRELIRGVFAEFLNKTFFDLGLNRGYKDSYDNKYVKQEVLKKHRILEECYRQTKQNGFGFFIKLRQINAFVLDKVTAQAISIYDTRLSLYHGVMIKDPTRDKRIVELLLRFPEDQFCDDGLERRLVREYLDDIVPAGIRLDPGHRGFQGADAAFRAGKFGREKMETIFQEEIWKYVDKDNVEKLFKESKLDLEHYYDIVRILALNCFILDMKKVV